MVLEVLKELERQLGSGTICRALGPGTAEPHTSDLDHFRNSFSRVTLLDDVKSQISQIDFSENMLARIQRAVAGVLEG